jgi:hypothetical protein
VAEHSIVERAFLKNLSRVTFAFFHHQHKVSSVKEEMVKNGKVEVIEFGLTQSNGLTAYYALDQVRFVTYYKRKGGQITLDHKMISSEIKSQIENSTLLVRRYVLIIEGDADFLAEWRNSVPEINVQICISTREVLKNLNIKIVDEDWKPGTRQISLNKLLSS